jgi:polar amino acid transport system permease protein
MVYPAEVFAFVALIYFVMCGALEWLCTALLGKPLHPQAKDPEDKTTKPRRAWQRIASMLLPGSPGLASAAGYLRRVRRLAHRDRRRAPENLPEHQRRVDFSRDWPG